MRPMKLRSQLLLLTLGALLPVVLFAAVGGWLLIAGLSDSVLTARETVWLMGAGIAAAVILALLLAAPLAPKIATPVAWVAGAAKALVSGARTPPPAKIRVLELAEAADA